MTESTLSTFTFVPGIFRDDADLYKPPSIPECSKIAWAHLMSKKHHRQSQSFYFNHQQWWDKPDQGCKDKLRQDASRWVWRGCSAEEVGGPHVVESQVWMAFTRRSWNDKLAAWLRLGHGETLKAHEISKSGLHRRWQSGHAAMLHYDSLSLLHRFLHFSWPC